MRKPTGIVLIVLLLLIAPVVHGAENPLPKEVAVVGEKAEDVIDLLLKRNWAGAQPIIDAIVQNGPAVEKEMQQTHVPALMSYEFDYLVFRLQELTHERKQPIQAALVANQITAIMIDLEGFYAHSAPLEIAWMDYFGREIVLTAQVPNDYGILKKRISQLDQTWTALKPSILDHNGKSVADSVDQVMTDLKKQPSQSQVVKDGNRILELVDQMEKLLK